MGLATPLCKNITSETTAAQWGCGTHATQESTGIMSSSLLQVYSDSPSMQARKQIVGKKGFSFQWDLNSHPFSLSGAQKMSSCFTAKLWRTWDLK